MDSVLSGFSNSYEGTQISQGYAGNVNVTGSTAASGSLQGVDVTQLQPGDTFQGEIVSVNGEDVQIQLANGQYMAAKLERDVQLALGQIMNLQVQSNKDNRVVLKPVYDSRMQMLRVAESALRAAHMAVNDRTMSLVSTLLENGMSINKNTLMLFNRLTLQNPNASIDDLIKLNKLQLPVNDSNLTQLQNYQNMEHKLLDGIREASDEILKLYDTLTGNQGIQGGTPENVQGAVSGQAALENGGKFMEQVLVLLAGEEGQTSEMQAVVIESNNTFAAQEGKNVQNNQPDAETNVQNNITDKTEANVENSAEGFEAIKRNPQEQAAETVGGRTIADKDAVQMPGKKETSADTVLNQLKDEKPQALPNRIISLIKDGKIDIKDVKQLLMDSDVGRQMTTEQKSIIFHSAPFKSMVKNGLQKQWTLTPQDLAQEGKVEEFYQKLAKESSQLTRMMNEAMQESGQNGNSVQARAMGNINENVEFMNQMNQMFTYVQLPLKLSNSQAHGDLYVYTNKKNMARKDGMLTAFLHLDMDNLGSLDVSISLQTERNQVTTKFYLDEDAIALVEKHIDELGQRLLKKGYQCKNMVLEKEENKTVLDHMEEQVAGGNAVLGYRTFDTRA